ncbi:schwannomin-interacting protein 1 [Latimeria chalumnae]|uniref:schwannomin-interacting protein 1 n=1 Tax=Latimeria chalumnae TaxID=7897 RepID=UPI0003C15E44|nr:PREDICTED: schwannomin-interacting protein 1-like [Latimeria chalumnae]|eukprot:XP_006013101.1 PREDICTED: schwannomin-interacting protein 1-like [Latimeria chalumnae]
MAPTEEEEDLQDQCDISREITVLTTRLQNRMNLQLCFINDSDSDVENENPEAAKGRNKIPAPNVQSRPPVPPREVKPSLGRAELQVMSVWQLQQLRESITGAIQNLNTELMQLLQMRDDLQTQQDAILVNAGDLPKPAKKSGTGDGSSKPDSLQPQCRPGC